MVREHVIMLCRCACSLHHDRIFVAQDNGVLPGQSTSLLSHCCPLEDTRKNLCPEVCGYSMRRISHRGQNVGYGLLDQGKYVCPCNIIADVHPESVLHLQN